MLNRHQHANAPVTGRFWNTRTFCVMSDAKKCVVMPVSVLAWRFWAPLLYLPVATLALWYIASLTPMRTGWVVATVALAASVSGFIFIFSVIDQRCEQRLGPVLDVDHEADTATLPRLGVKMPLRQVKRVELVDLRWTRSPQSDSSYAAVRSLRLVGNADRDEEVLYTLVAQPAFGKSLARGVASVLRVPLKETTLDGVNEVDH